MAEDRRVEKVRLGGADADEHVRTRTRDDGLLESSYYVHEATGLHYGITRRLAAPKTLPRMTPWKWLQTKLGLIAWYYEDAKGHAVCEPEEPHVPRRPGRVWHGFSAVGGPISEVTLLGTGQSLWRMRYDPPLRVIPPTAPFGLDWPAYLLAYHDLVLAVVHAPGSSVDIREEWSDAAVRSAAGTWEAPITGTGRVDPCDTALKIVSGMIATVRDYQRTRGTPGKMY